jgi:hypothetical protein
MADLSDAQRKRAEARQRRRKAEPEQEHDDSGGEDTAPDQEDSHHAVRQAAKVAAAAGAAGAVAAAARALANHQDDGEDEDDHEAPEQEEQQQPQARQEEPEPEPEPEDGGRRDDGRVDGAPASDARRALDQGRSQLEDLLGRPVESVSALERTHDGWVLGLEVVEVRRIPETTDVLASYELELDDGLDLRRYQQVRRYHRAQAERGEAT